MKMNLDPGRAFPKAFGTVRLRATEATRVGRQFRAIRDLLSAIIYFRGGSASPLFAFSFPPGSFSSGLLLIPNRTGGAWASSLEDIAVESHDALGFMTTDENGGSGLFSFPLV